MAVVIYYPNQTKKVTPGWTGDQTTFGCLAKGGKIREAQGEIKVCPTCGRVLSEVAPPGWEGTVKAMKKHKDIDNPWALSWYMKGQGDQPQKEVRESDSLAPEKLQEALTAQAQMRSCGVCPTGKKKLQEASSRAMGHRGPNWSGSEAGMQQYQRIREQAAPIEPRGAVSKFSPQDLIEARIAAAHRFLVSEGKMPKLLDDTDEAMLRACYEAHMQYAANYGQNLGERRLEELRKRCDEIAERLTKMQERRRQAEVGTASIRPTAPEGRTPAEQTAGGFR